ncbi:Putative ribosomal RNA-processing protein 7 homolog B [Lemmus lemmus]
MEAYDKKIAEEETKAKEEKGVPDEEGWVKVTRRGCRPVLPRTEAASLRVLEKEKELLNFYVCSTERPRWSTSHNCARS